MIMALDFGVWQEDLLGKGTGKSSGGRNISPPICEETIMAALHALNSRALRDASWLGNLLTEWSPAVILYPSYQSHVCVGGVNTE
jgi:hypothetical protein